MRLIPLVTLAPGSWGVGRHHSRYSAPTMEYWNENLPSGPGWASCCTVYYTKEEAAAKLYQLCGMVTVNPARRPARASR